MPDKVPNAAARQPASLPSAEGWPSEATDLIVRNVGTVREKAVGPAITAARAMVFGLFAAMVATAAAVLVSIALIRVLTVYIPGHRVWVSYLIVGGLFVVIGLALWTRTRASRQRGAST